MSVCPDSAFSRDSRGSREDLAIPRLSLYPNLTAGMYAKDGIVATKVREDNTFEVVLTRADLHEKRDLSLVEVQYICVVSG